MTKIQCVLCEIGMTFAIRPEESNVMKPAALNKEHFTCPRCGFTFDHHHARLDLAILRRKGWVEISSPFRAVQCEQYFKSLGICERIKLKGRADILYNEKGKEYVESLKEEAHS